MNKTSGRASASLGDGSVDTADGDTQHEVGQAFVASYGFGGALNWFQYLDIEGATAATGIATPEEQETPATPIAMAMATAIAAMSNQRVLVIVQPA